MVFLSHTVFVRSFIYSIGHSLILSLCHLFSISVTLLVSRSLLDQSVAGVVVRSVGHSLTRSVSRSVSGSLVWSLHKSVSPSGFALVCFSCGTVMTRCSLAQEDPVPAPNDPALALNDPVPALDDPVRGHPQ